MGFRKDVGFSGPSRGPIEMTLRNQHVRPEDLFFFFGDHLISTGKTVRILVQNFFIFEDHQISTGKGVKISVKTFFFFFFWSSHHNSDKTAAFSPSVLEFTKPEIRHIRTGPGPTFGSRRPCINLVNLMKILKHSLSVREIFFGSEIYGKMIKLPTKANCCRKLIRMVAMFAIGLLRRKRVALRTICSID